MKTFTIIIEHSNLPGGNKEALIWGPMPLEMPPTQFGSLGAADGGGINEVRCGRGQKRFPSSGLEVVEHSLSPR